MKLTNSLRFALTYLCLGALWVYFSDTVVAAIFRTDEQRHFYQTIKGLVYVVSTSILLYILLRHFYQVQRKKTLELRKKEQNLRESESRYSLLFKESSLANILVNAENGSIVEVNAKVVDLLGCGPEDLVGLNVMQLFPEYIFENKDAENGLRLVSYYCSDGRIVQVEITSVRLRLDSNDCMMLLCNDVTAREQSFRTLQDLQQKLLSAQKIAKIGYWRYSIDKGELFWSDEVYEIWGVNRDEFSINYDNFFSSIHPDDQHYFPENAQFPLQEFDGFDVEHRIICPSGAVKWVHEIGKLHNSTDGLHIYLEGTIQDITDKKITSLALEENLQRYNWIVQAISDAIWDWNLEDQTIVWNYGTSPLLSQLERIVVNDNSVGWEDYIVPEDRKKVMRGLNKALASNVQLWNAEFRCKTVDNTYLFVSCNAYILRNKKGRAVKVIGAIKDITENKRKALQHEFTQMVRSAFNSEHNLEEALLEVLNFLRRLGNFQLEEAWIVGREKTTISLANFSASDNIRNVFYSDINTPHIFKMGESLVGTCWEQGNLIVWDNVTTHQNFKRGEYARAAGVNSMYAVPLKYNNEVLGVVLFGQAYDDIQARVFSNLLDSIYSDLAAEIRRKQAELDIKQLFEFVPDIICIAGADGFFKKINPALVKILGFSEQELLSKPVFDFVYPDDIEPTKTRIGNIQRGGKVAYFENRYVTKSGTVKWIAWTSTEPSKEGLVFSVGKDITDKKELELLLTKATTIAKIGAWEIDLIANKIYWSEMTRLIHGVNDNLFNPTFEEAELFFKEGENREKVVAKIDKAISKGESWDVEAQVLTLQNEEKWVRAIGEPEFVNGKCVRIVGSFQDIDERKKTENAAIEALKEKEAILERIGDAFYAVNKDWIVIYWNNRAEQVLGRKREEVIGHNLWQVYRDVVGTEFHTRYYEAIESGEATSFQAYYEGTQAWYEVSAFPSHAGLSIFFRDITERRKHINAIEQSNRTLKEIAWSQSHEVRAPLTRILGLVNLIEALKMDATKEVEEVLEMVIASVHELDEIVRKITDKTYNQ
ncbi:MAG TPA: PAS domain S-box protein [Flavipsychrobacter sp.]|nr:PAS domain S-box protein [Flavipsychrobacter sp.]